MFLGSIERQNLPYFTKDTKAVCLDNFREWNKEFRLQLENEIPEEHSTVSSNLAYAILLQALEPHCLRNCSDSLIHLMIVHPRWTDGFTVRACTFECLIWGQISQRPVLSFTKRAKKAYLPGIKGLALSRCSINADCLSWKVRFSNFCCSIFCHWEDSLPVSRPRLKQANTFPATANAL